MNHSQSTAHSISTLTHHTSKSIMLDQPRVTCSPPLLYLQTRRLRVAPLSGLENAFSGVPTHHCQNLLDRELINCTTSMTTYSDSLRFVLGNYEGTTSEHSKQTATCRPSLKSWNYLECGAYPYRPSKRISTRMLVETPVRLSRTSIGHRCKSGCENHSLP